MINIDLLYKTYGIYGIVNKINSKIYVGKTEMNFGDRRDSYYSCLRGGYHENPHLQNAWNEYGEENFEFIVLQECMGRSTEEINQLERDYIKKYKDLGLAYNISDGGDGGYLLGKHLTDEAKRKIGEKNRQHMTGRKLPLEVKEKMSKSQKERYEKMTEEDRKLFGKIVSEKSRGYKWSEESKEKFSKIQQSNPNGAKYDVETVKEIRKLHEVENKSYTEIAKITGIPRGTVYNIATYRRWKNIVA